MGPPAGMNLRNVMWHGFSKETEFPRCYFTFLLCLIDWIGARVQAADHLAVGERPLLSFSGFYAQHSAPTLASLRTPHAITTLARLFSGSDFVVASTEADWVNHLVDFHVSLFQPPHCLGGS